MVRKPIGELRSSLSRLAPGRLAETNAQQVSKMRQVLEGMSLEIATPEEARDMLSLKGGDRVGF